MNQTKIDKNKVVIVLPAYNASKTLKRTLVEIPPIYAALIILVDDASTDNTVEIAKEAGIQVFQHQIFQLLSYKALFYSFTSFPMQFFVLFVLVCLAKYCFELFGLKLSCQIL